MLNLVKHKVSIDTAPPLVDAVDVGAAGRVERLDAVLALSALAVVVRLRGYPLFIYNLLFINIIIYNLL